MDRALAIEWCERLLSNPEALVRDSLEKTSVNGICGYCVLGMLSYVADWYDENGVMQYPEDKIPGDERTPPLKDIAVKIPNTEKWSCLISVNDTHKYSVKQLVEVILLNVDDL